MEGNHKEGRGKKPKKLRVEDMKARERRREEWEYLDPDNADDLNE